MKVAYDAYSATKAYHLRSLSIEPGMSWCARRWARFMARLGIGMLREVHGRLSERPFTAAKNSENIRKTA